MNQDPLKEELVALMLAEYRQELEDCTVPELLAHVQAMKKTKALTDEEWRKLMGAKEK